MGADQELPVLLQKGAAVMPAAAVLPGAAPAVSKPAVIVPGAAPAADISAAAVPAIETRLQNGVVIPSKKDLAHASMEDLGKIYAAGVAALTKDLEASRDKLPSLAFSGGIGRNIDTMIKDKGGPAGGAWVAGVRNASPDIKTYVNDLINSATDASSYVSLDPNSHRGSSHTLGGVTVLNLDNAPNKGTTPARALSEISPNKYGSGNSAERMQVVLNPENYDRAVVGVISWDKCPAGLNLRSTQPERGELVTKFRALYAVSEAIRLSAHGDAQVASR